MTYITLRLRISKPSYKVALLFALCVVCVIVLSCYKDYFWYDTMLCYPLGFMFSTYKDTIETHLKRAYWKYVLAVFVAFLPVYWLFHDCSVDRFQIGYNVIGMLFALLIVILTLKVSINNQPLRWLGTHLFPIYIYMRLPMILMQQKVPGLVDSYPALYIVICLAVTLIIAYHYKFWEIKL